MRESAQKFMKASLDSCQEEAPHAMFILMQTIEQHREVQNNISHIHDSESLRSVTEGGDVEIYEEAQCTRKVNCQTKVRSAAGERGCGVAPSVVYTYNESV